MDLHALSLHQPWATLFVLGPKLFETRTWSDMRAIQRRIAVHATQSTEYDYVGSEPGFAEVLSEAGLDPDRLPHAGIIGTVFIHEIYPTDTLNRPDFYPHVLLAPGGPHASSLMTAQERRFGNFGPQRHAWLGRDRQSFDVIPCRGAQRLWRVPMELQHEIHAITNGAKA